MDINNLITIRPDAELLAPDEQDNYLVNPDGSFNYEATQFQLHPGVLPDQKDRRRYDYGLYEATESDVKSLFKYLQPGQKADAFAQAVTQREEELPTHADSQSLLDVVMEAKPIPIIRQQSFAKFIARDIPEHEINKLIASPAMRRIIAVADASDTDEEAASAILASDEAINYMLAHADRLDNSVYEWWRQIRGNNEISSALAATSVLVAAGASASGVKKAATKLSWFRRHFPSLAKLMAEESVDLSAKGIAKQAAKKTSKLSRFIPFVDAAASAYFAKQRIDDGDYFGAALESASSAISAFQIAALSGVISAPLAVAAEAIDLPLDIAITAYDVIRWILDKGKYGRALAQDVIRGYGKLATRDAFKMGRQITLPNKFRGSSALKIAAAVGYGWEAASNLFLDSDPYKPKPLSFDQEIETVLDTLGENQGARFLYSRALVKMAEQSAKLRTLDEASPSYRQERAAILSKMRAIVNEIKNINTKVSGVAYAALDPEDTVKILRESGYAPERLAKSLSRKKEAIAAAEDVVPVTVATGHDVTDAAIAAKAISMAQSDVINEYFGGNEESFYGTLNKRPEEIKGLIIDAARKRSKDAADTIGYIEQMSPDDIAAQLLKESFTDEVSKQRATTLSRTQAYIDSRTHTFATLAAARIVEQDFKEKFVNGKVTVNDMQAYAEQNFQSVYDRIYPAIRKSIVDKLRNKISSMKAIAPDDADAAYVKLKEGIPDYRTYGLTEADANIVSTVNRELYQRTTENTIEDAIGIQRIRDINPYYEYDLTGTPFADTFGKKDLFGNLSHLSDDALSLLLEKLQLAAQQRDEIVRRARDEGQGSKQIGIAEFNAYRTYLTLNWIKDLMYLRSRAAGNDAEPEDIIARDVFPSWMDATKENWKKDYWIGKIFAISRGSTAHAAGDIAADDALELKRLRIMREWFLDKGDNEAAEYITQRLDFYEKAIKHIAVSTGIAAYKYDTLPVVLQMLVETPFNVGQNISSGIQSVAGAAAFSKLGRLGWLTRTHDNIISDYFAKWVSDKIAATANRFAKAETVLGPWFTSILDTTASSPGIFMRQINDNWALKQAKRFEEYVANFAKDTATPYAVKLKHAEEYIQEIDTALREAYDTPDLFKPTVNRVARLASAALGYIPGTKSTIDALDEFAKRIHWYPTKPVHGVKAIISMVVSRNASDAIDAADPTAIVNAARNAIINQRTPEEVRAIATSIRKAFMYSPSVPQSAGWHVSFAKKLIHGLTRANERFAVARAREMMIDATEHLLKGVTGEELTRRRKVLDEAIESIMFAHKAAEMYNHHLDTAIAGVETFAKGFAKLADDDREYEALFQGLQSAYKAVISHANVRISDEHIEMLRTLSLNMVHSSDQRAVTYGSSLFTALRGYRQILDSAIGENNPASVRMLVMNAADVMSDEYQHAEGTLLGAYRVIRNAVEYALRTSDVEVPKGLTEAIDRILPNEALYKQVIDDVVNAMSTISKEQKKKIHTLLEMPTLITMGDGSDVGGQNDFIEGAIRFLTHAVYDSGTIEENVKNNLYGRINYLKRTKRVGTFELVERTVNEMLRGPVIDRGEIMRSQHVKTGIESVLDDLLTPRYDEVFIGGSQEAVYLGERVTPNDVAAHVVEIDGVQHIDFRAVLNDRGASGRIPDMRKVLEERLQQYIDTTLPGRTTPYTESEILNALQPKGQHIRYELYTPDEDYIKPVINEIHVKSEDGLSSVTINLDKADQATLLEIVVNESGRFTEEQSNLAYDHLRYRATRGHRPKSPTAAVTRVTGETPANINVTMLSPSGELLTTNELSSAQPGRFGVLYQTMSSVAGSDTVNVRVYDLSSGTPTKLEFEKASYVVIPEAQVMVVVDHVNGRDILAETLSYLTGIDKTKVLELFRNPYFIKNTKAVKQLFSNTLPLVDAAANTIPDVHPRVDTLLNRMLHVVSDHVRREVQDLHKRIPGLESKLADLRSKLLQPGLSKSDARYIGKQIVAVEKRLELERKTLRTLDAGSARIISKLVRNQMFGLFDVLGNIVDVRGNTFNEFVNRVEASARKVVRQVVDSAMQTGQLDGDDLVKRLIDEIQVEHDILLNEFIPSASDIKALETNGQILQELKRALYTRQFSEREEPAYEYGKRLVARITEHMEHTRTAQVLKEAQENGRTLSQSERQFMDKWLNAEFADRPVHSAQKKIIVVNDKEFSRVVAERRKQALNARAVTEEEKKLRDYQVMLYDRLMPVSDGFEYTSALLQPALLTNAGLDPTSEMKAFTASDGLVTKGLSGVLWADQRAVMDDILRELGIDDPGFLTGETFKVTTTKNMRAVTDISTDAQGNAVKNVIAIGKNQQTANSIYKTDKAVQLQYNLSEERVFTDLIKSAHAKRASGRTPLQNMSRGYVTDLVSDFVNMWTGNTVTVDAVNRWLQSSIGSTEDFNMKLARLVCGDVSWNEIYNKGGAELAADIRRSNNMIRDVAEIIRDATGVMSAYGMSDASAALRSLKRTVHAITATSQGTDTETILSNAIKTVFGDAVLKKCENVVAKYGTNLESIVERMGRMSRIGDMYDVNGIPMHDPLFARQIQRNAINIIEEARKRSSASLYYVPFFEGLMVTGDGMSYRKAEPLLMNEVYLPRAYKGMPMDGGGEVRVGTQLWIVDSPAYWTDNSGIFTVKGFHDGDGIIIDPHTVRQHQGDFDGDTASVIFKRLTKDFIARHGITYRGTPTAIDLAELADLVDAVNDALGDDDYKGEYSRAGLIQLLGEDTFKKLRVDEMVYYPDDNIWERFVTALMNKRHQRLRTHVNSILTSRVTDDEVMRAVAKQVEYGTMDNKVNMLARLINFFDQLGDIDVVAIARDKPIKEILGNEYQSLKRYVTDIDLTAPLATAFTGIAPQQPVSRNTLDKYVRLATEQMLIGLDREVAKVPLWTFLDTAKDERIPTFLGMNVWKYDENELPLIDRAIVEMLLRVRYVEELADDATRTSRGTFSHRGLFNNYLYKIGNARKATLQQFIESAEARSLVSKSPRTGRTIVNVGELLKPARKRLLADGDIESVLDYQWMHSEFRRHLEESPLFGPSVRGRRIYLDIADDEIANLDFGPGFKQFYEEINGISMTPAEFAKVRYMDAVNRHYHSDAGKYMPSRHYIEINALPARRAADGSANVVDAVRALEQDIQAVTREARISNVIDPFAGVARHADGEHYVNAYVSYTRGKATVVVDSPKLGIEDLAKPVAQMMSAQAVQERVTIVDTMNALLQAAATNADASAANVLGLYLGSFLRNANGGDAIFEHVLSKLLEQTPNRDVVELQLRTFLTNIFPDAESAKQFAGFVMDRDRGGTASLYRDWAQEIVRKYEHELVQSIAQKTPDEREAILKAFAYGLFNGGASNQPVVKKLVYEIEDFDRAAFNAARSDAGFNLYDGTKLRQFLEDSRAVALHDNEQTTMISSVSYPSYFLSDLPLKTHDHATYVSYAAARNTDAATAITHPKPVNKMTPEQYDAVRRRIAQIQSTLPDDKKTDNPVALLANTIDYMNGESVDFSRQSLGQIIATNDAGAFRKYERLGRRDSIVHVGKNEHRGAVAIAQYINKNIAEASYKVEPLASALMRDAFMSHPAPQRTELSRALQNIVRMYKQFMLGFLGGGLRFLTFNTIENLTKAMIYIGEETAQGRPTSYSDVLRFLGTSTTVNSDDVWQYAMSMHRASVPSLDKRNAMYLRQVLQGGFGMNIWDRYSRRGVMNWDETTNANFFRKLLDSYENMMSKYMKWVGDTFETPFRKGVFNDQLIKQMSAQRYAHPDFYSMMLHAAKNSNKTVDEMYFDYANKLGFLSGIGQVLFPFGDFRVMNTNYWISRFAANPLLVRYAMRPQINMMTRKGRDPRSGKFKIPFTDMYVNPFTVMSFNDVLRHITENPYFKEKERREFEAVYQKIKDFPEDAQRAFVFRQANGPQLMEYIQWRKLKPAGEIAAFLDSFLGVNAVVKGIANIVAGAAVDGKVFESQPFKGNLGAAFELVNAMWPSNGNLEATFAMKLLDPKHAAYIQQQNEKAKNLLVRSMNMSPEEAQRVVSANEKIRQGIAFVTGLFPQHIPKELATYTDYVAKIAKQPPVMVNDIQAFEKYMLHSHVPDPEAYALFTRTKLAIDSDTGQSLIAVPVRGDERVQYMFVARPITDGERAVYVHLAAAQNPLYAEDAKQYYGKNFDEWQYEAFALAAAQALRPEFRREYTLRRGVNPTPVSDAMRRYFRENRYEYLKAVREFLRSESEGSVYSIIREDLIDDMREVDKFERRLRTLPKVDAKTLSYTIEHSPSWLARYAAKRYVWDNFTRIDWRKPNKHARMGLEALNLTEADAHILKMYSLSREHFKELADLTSFSDSSDITKTAWNPSKIETMSPALKRDLQRLFPDFEIKVQQGREYYNRILNDSNNAPRIDESPKEKIPKQIADIAKAPTRRMVMQLTKSSVDWINQHGLSDSLEKTMRTGNPSFISDAVKRRIAFLGWQ